MTQQEIQDRNKKIAIMIGVKPCKDWQGFDGFEHTSWYHTQWSNRFQDNLELYSYRYSDLKFDSDWNWLMEAIEFIGKQTHKGFPINCTIGRTGCSINVNPTNVMGDKFEGKTEIVNTLNINYPIVDKKEKGLTKKEAVFIAVSDFARLYNENKL